MAPAPDGVSAPGPSGGGCDRAAARYPAGTVLALVDAQRQCHGSSRILPCLLRQGRGWRIGPLLADNPELAARLLRRLGFVPISEALRMYRGTQPQVSLADVYGLACLELG